MNRKKIGIGLLLLIMLILVLQPDLEQRGQASFALAIIDPHKTSFWPRKLTYFTWESLWPLLRRAYPDAVVYQIDSTDIAQYNGDTQAMMLTKSGSEKLFNALQCTKDERTTPYVCLCEYNFVVLLNQQPIFGGDFAEIGSAISRPYPVIYPNSRENVLAFQIHSQHPAWAYELTQPGKEMIQAEKLRQYFMRVRKYTSQ